MTTAHRPPVDDAAAREPAAAAPSPGPLTWRAVVTQVRRDWLAAGIVLFAIGLLIGLIVTSVGPRGTGELGADVAISHHRDGVATAIAQTINLLDGSLLGPLILLVVCALIWLRSRSSALILASLTLIGWLSVGAAKIVFHRHRPPAATVHALVHETGLDSFPSGHTAFIAAAVAAAAVTLRVAGRSMRPALLIGVPVLVLVALSRLYLGAHFYGDVIAAPFFTTGTVLGVCALSRPLVVRRQQRSAA